MKDSWDEFSGHSYPLCRNPSADAFSLTVKRGMRVNENGKSVFPRIGLMDGEFIFPIAAFL